MKYIGRFAILLAIGLSIGQPLIVLSGQEISHFEFSGPILSMLHFYQCSATLEDVEKEFASSVASSNSPIDATLHTARHFGLNLTFEKCSIEKLKNKPLPLLAIMSDYELGKEVYEMVLLSEVGNSDFRVYEFRVNQGWHTYEEPKMLRSYSGYVFRKDDTGINRFYQAFAILFTLWLLVIVFRVFYSCKLGRSLLAVSIVMYAGCDSTSDRSVYQEMAEPMFSPAKVNLGELLPDQIYPIEFSLKSGSNAVDLREVVASCGCIIIRQAPLGEHLPESNLAIEASLSTAGQVGLNSYLVRVVLVCDDKEFTRESMVTYFVKSRPKVYPDEIELTRVGSNDPFEGLFTLILQQSKESPLAVLELNQSENLPFELTLEKSEQSFSGGAGSTRDDRFHIRASLNPKHIEIASSMTIRLSIAGISEELRVPVTLRSIPLVEPLQKNIFLGTVKENDSIQSTVRLKNHSQRNVPIEIFLNQKEETKLLDSFVLVPGLNKVLCRIESGEGSGRKNKTLVVQPTADDFE